MDLLLITRGFLAISVVIWHFSGYQSHVYPLLNLPGRTAVWLFFGISGYVIAYGFIHKRYYFKLSDLKDFYINRLLRIYPLFFAISSITLITEWVVSERMPIGFREIAPQLLLMQFNHSYILNGVFWTLGIELQFYIIAPLLTYVFLMNADNSKLFLPFLLYLISLLVFYCLAHFMDWSFDGRNIISNLPHFLVGMFACQFVSKVSINMRQMIYSIIFALILLAYTNWIYQHNPGKYWSIKGIILVDAIVFLLVLAHSNIQNITCKFNHTKNLLFMFGVLSYGIYAWHGYILKYISFLSTNLLVLMLATTLFSYLSYRIIELPALRLKQEKNHSPIKIVIN